MEVFIMILFAFLIMMAISSFLNIMLKTTKKKDWLISFLLSTFLSIVLVMFLGS